MNKSKFFKKLICSMLILIFPLFFTSSALSEKNSEIKNITNYTKNGHKWRIGYCESRPYANYAGTLYYLVKGLNSIGWISDVSKLNFNWGQTDTREMWNWLSSNNMGPNIEFVKDAYYSLDNDASKGEEVVKRLMENKDIDLMITMGTNAGKLLARDDYNTPIMVFSTSNAVQSGIVSGIEDSRSNHIWAHMDPNRYRQQLEVFYDMFKFKKLGFVYEDSPNGMAYAALYDIKYVAKEKGFEIVPYTIEATKGADDQDRYFNDLIAIHKKMAQEVDAYYYTIAQSPGLKIQKLSEALQPFYEEKIPTFSQLGEEEVMYGALLSIARPDFSGVGLFGAEQMTKFLTGVPANKLNQVFGDTPSIALNIEVANKIGYKPPFDIMLVADKVYTEIKK